MVLKVPEIQNRSMQNGEGPNFSIIPVVTCTATRTLASSDGWRENESRLVRQVVTCSEVNHLQCTITEQNSPMPVSLKIHPNIEIFSTFVEVFHSCRHARNRYSLRVEVGSGASVRVRSLYYLETNL